MKGIAATFIILCAAVMVLAALAGGGGSAGSKEVSAEDAASIGDVVIIRYTNGTIMCEDPTDADKVYIAGENALRESMRIDPSLKNAIDAKVAARNRAMQQAMSCQRSPEPRDLRYIVKDKRVVGTEKDSLHVASYCIKPTNRADDTCWWIEETATMSAQIVKETRP